MKKLISTALLASILLSLSACGGAPEERLTPNADPTPIKSTNLMENVTPSSEDIPEISNKELASDNELAADFALRLFKESYTDSENVLISPLSVMSALAMTASGANGNTLTEMESVLGMTSDELNEYIRAYTASLPQSHEYKLHIANSIWFTDDQRFTVNEAFLKKNADYYGADIYKTPFDNTTLTDINSWVNQNTDGMIPNILDKIPSDAVMYLINALAFEAQWVDPYLEHQVREGTFYNGDGTETDVMFMNSNEYSYLEDENATGFIRYYKDRKYAFAALLPNAGVKLADYVSSLTGEHIHDMLSEPMNATVYAKLPKFEYEYGTEMSELLKSMGMSDAFHPDLADFTGLGSSTAGNIFISRVIHKTFISVAEQGTKAGAATVVVAADGASMETEEPKEVYLDRPFVYMIIDTENNVPFFVGTVTNLG